MSGVRRQPKRLFIIAIFVCIFLIMLGLYRSMMPRLGAEQSCDTSSDGESIAINGHIMWIKVLNRESKATPIYVLGGGPGFSTNYLEKSLRFLAKDHPVIFLMVDAVGAQNIQPIFQIVPFKIMQKIWKFCALV